MYKLEDFDIYVPIGDNYFIHEDGTVWRKFDKNTYTGESIKEHKNYIIEKVNIMKDNNGNSVVILDGQVHKVINLMVNAFFHSHINELDNVNFTNGNKNDLSKENIYFGKNKMRIYILLFKNKEIKITNSILDIGYFSTSKLRNMLYNKQTYQGYKLKLKVIEKGD